MKNRGPVSAKLPRLWHGGDYNPDQWRHDPAVLEDDVRLMGLAGCNAMSVAIFAWAALEPEEGRYDLDWLDAVVDRLHAAGVFTVLATPSGARPAWMAERYPEVLRVEADGRRNLFGVRHNHCFTSPVYRKKVLEINGRLAERFGRHPGVLLWHLSNEYGGECHCDLCQEAFRSWLRRRYHDDLDAINRAWWTSFWSHTLTRVVPGSLPDAARRTVRARAEPGLASLRHRPDRGLHARGDRAARKPRRPSCP